MLESLPAWILVVGLIFVVGPLYARAFRVLDRAEHADASGTVVLTSQERAILRGLGRQVVQEFEINRLVS